MWVASVLTLVSPSRSMVWLPSADSSLGYRQLNSVAVLDGCAPTLASLVVLGVPGVCTKHNS
jgi:hypothetical protein